MPGQRPEPWYAPAGVELVEELAGEGSHLHVECLVARLVEKELFCGLQRQVLGNVVGLHTSQMGVR